MTARTPADSRIHPAHEAPAPDEQESLDVWGFRDTAFRVRPDGAVVLSGDRYALCGEELADLLRINTGLPQTAPDKQKRLGVLAGDLGGFPNGRRPIDDTVDISLRVVAGILVDAKKYGTLLGDGVNTDGDLTGFRNTFPYVQPALSGRDSFHRGPGQGGCNGQPDGVCPTK